MIKDLDLYKVLVALKNEKGSEKVRYKQLSDLDRSRAHTSFLNIEGTVII